MSDGQDEKNKRSPEGSNQRRQGSSGPPPGRYQKNASWIFFFLLCVMLLMMFKPLTEKAGEISFKEFCRRAGNAEVKEVTISDTSLIGAMKPEAMEGKEIGERFKAPVPVGIGKEQWFVQMLNESGADWNYEQPNGLLEILKYMLPWIIIIAVMYFFIFRQLRGAGGAGMLGGFLRSKHRVSSKDQSKVTFEHVAGIDEAKDEVQEVIQFLRDPKKFQRLGGRIPRGVLLIGEPGCGKTLLAKAIAGEADVPFFSISGSDFVEMFVGVGASRVRDLFKQAKENSPCIIFLDEIDAVGRKRGMGLAGGGHDEREQTLNAILVEMDGFSTNDQVIVIAATNRADVLDHALTRPGRFDRQIYVPLPDIKGRYGILKVHARKIKISPDVDLYRMARGTPMFSGADLEAIINEAALAATMSDKDHVEMEDLEEARDKVRWGRARRSRVVDEKERIATAYHESGHALVQSLTENADPLHKVSIIPRSNMGGATFSLPEKDRTMYTQKYCLAMIRIAFGGRLAEEMFCNDISSGAQGDIRQATEIAKKMVMEWGMSEKLGFVNYGSDQAQGWFADMPGSREYSDNTAEKIDSEINGIMAKAYEDVKELIDGHRSQLEALKDALLKYETLDSDEVKQIIAGGSLDRPTVADLLAEEQKRIADDAKSAAKDAEPVTSPDELAGPMPSPEPT